MRVPGPNLKIKIVLPVSLRCALLNAPTERRLQDSNQTARQQTSLKVPKWVHLLCPAREITEKCGVDVSWKNEITSIKGPGVWRAANLIALYQIHRSLAFGP